MRVMVLIDNEFLLGQFMSLIETDEYRDVTWDFFFSESNVVFRDKYESIGLQPINLVEDLDMIVDTYQLALSIHSKQLFPKRLVESIRCINIHPGYNPHNRGWFPQVFSIINKLPVGVTIHEMDEQLDHGPIIAQERIEIHPWETSYDIYRKIQDKEVEMLQTHLKDIVDNNYDTFTPELEGNINLKRDFIQLCEIDLQRRPHFNKSLTILGPCLLMDTKMPIFVMTMDGRYMLPSV